MTNKQEDWMTAELLDAMKLPESRERSVRRYVRRAADKILIYCNRDDLPDSLMNTAVQIAEDMMKADQAVEEKQEVASISRGDTAISYRDGSAKTKTTIDFMKDYEKALNHFKRMNLPEDKKT